MTRPNPFTRAFAEALAHASDTTPGMKLLARMALERIEELEREVAQLREKLAAVALALVVDATVDEHPVEHPEL